MTAFAARLGKHDLAAIVREYPDVTIVVADVRRFTPNVKAALECAQAEGPVVLLSPTWFGPSGDDRIANLQKLPNTSILIGRPDYSQIVEAVRQVCA